MDFGLIIDVETTGLDPVNDQIIELGLIEFGVSGDELPRVIRSYGSLQDPKREISPEIERLTGISNAHVKDQAIDWAIVRSFFARAEIVIAHNADFDRRFIEATGELEGNSLHWGCSMRHVDWQSLGFKSLALNYLAADHGFVNPFAHQALFDCATTFRLIAPHLKDLIARSYEREFIVKAVGSPFESKNVLRERGYRWDAVERCWGRTISETALAEERQFLRGAVYRGEPRHQEIAVVQG